MTPKTKQMVEKEPTVRTGAKKFPVEKLQANCQQLFNVSTSTFAGATYGMTGSYTVEEMKAHLETWKKKGVK